MPNGIAIHPALYLIALITVPSADLLISNPICSAHISSFINQQIS